MGAQKKAQRKKGGFADLSKLAKGKGKQFRLMDSNSDGAVSLDEVVAVIEKLRNRAEASGIDLSKRDLKYHQWKNFDATESNLLQKTVVNPLSGGPEGWFKYMDRNNDSKLTLPSCRRHR